MQLMEELLNRVRENCEKDYKLLRGVELLECYEVATRRLIFKSPSDKELLHLLLRDILELKEILIQRRNEEC